MGRHDSPPGSAGGGLPRRTGGRLQAARWAVIALVAVAASTLVVRVAANRNDTAPTSSAGCGTALRVVTSTSFARVVERVAPELGDGGPDCVRVDVGTLDGRLAAERIGEVDADVWIADDRSWAGVANPAAIAETGLAGSGTVLATSPIYLVADRATARRITGGGGSWLALERLLTSDSGVRLAVADPAGSGDGLVAVGAVGEAVWQKQGMDASARALATVFTKTRTVSGVRPVRPEKAGEVALVPEHALLAGGRRPSGEEAVLAPTDHTALLRYTWLPLAAAVLDPVRKVALGRLLTALTGPRGITALTAAGLRTPAGKASTGERSAGKGSAGQPSSGQPSAGEGYTEDNDADRLPAGTAPPYDVLGPHKVFHVFATWYPADRRTKLLIAVDVSGSMGDPAPGTRTPLISYVQQGCLAVGNLLPPDASLTLWEFGSLLVPQRDYRTLLPTTRVSAASGARLRNAVAKLAALPTGTALYDTILAAYKEATATYKAGQPNRVMVFTDGRNEDDPGSITADQLATRLAAAADPDRPVELVVVAFGNRPDVGVVRRAVKPVGGTVDPLDSAEEVLSMFVHLAAGGLHA